MLMRARTHALECACQAHTHSSVRECACVIYVVHTVSYNTIEEHAFPSPVQSPSPPRVFSVVHVSLVRHSCCLLDRTGAHT